MKRSVTSRCQRFLAVLLAVVMVVGLLPSAGVKAGDNVISISAEEDFANLGVNHSILQGGEDVLSGGYESDFSGAGCAVVYNDPNKDTIWVDYILQTTENGNSFIHKIKTKTYIEGADPVYTDDYRIKTYKQVLAESEKAGIYDGEILADNQITDKWQIVSVGYGPEVPENYVIKLVAVPKYKIKWVFEDDETYISGVALPETFVAVDDEPIDLDPETTPYRASKDNYRFAGWEYKYTVLTGQDTTGVEEGYSYDDCLEINAENVKSFDLKKVKDDSLFDAYEIVLRPKWMPIYKINFEKGINDEIAKEVTGTMEPQEVDMPWLVGEGPGEDEIVLHQCQYSRIGYCCYEWLMLNDQGEYTSVSFIPRRQDQLEQGDSITVYANWEPDLKALYSVEFKTNSPEECNPKLQNPESLEVSYWVSENQESKLGTALMPDVAKNINNEPKHYNFVGWRVAAEIQEGTEDTRKTYLPREAPTVQNLIKEADLDHEPEVINMEGQWEAKEYSIVFDKNNADVTKQTAPAGFTPVAYDANAVKIPTMDPENGYTFMGWAFTADATNAVINSSNTIKEIVDAAEQVPGAITLAGNGTANVRYDTITLYGVWKAADDVTLTYNGNKGSGKPDSETGRIGQVIDLPDGNAYTRPGFVLKGWSKDNRYDGNDPDELYAPGSNYALGADETLYAIWDAKKYTINFVTDPSGMGEFENPDYDDLAANPASIASVTVTYDPDEDDGPEELRNLKDTAGHFTFCGWAFYPEGTGRVLDSTEDPISYDEVIYVALENYPELIAEPEEGGYEQITLYAVWVPKEYTINYIVNPNGLDITLDPDKVDYHQTGIYYEEVSEALANIDIGLKDKRDLYKFIGWAFTKDSDTPVIHVGDEDDDPWCFFEIIEYVYKNGLTNCIITPEPDEETDEVGNDYINLYAVWQEKDSYYVEFDPNADGDRELSGQMNSQKFYTGVEQALDQNNYTRYGYKFVGWATSADGAKEYDDQQAVKDLPAEDGIITLYAVWEKKYEVAFYKGYPIENQEVDFYTDAIGKIPNWVIEDDTPEAIFGFDPYPESDELYVLEGCRLVSFDVLTDIEYDDYGLIASYKRESNYPSFSYEDLIGKTITYEDILKIGEVYADENKVIHVAALWAADKHVIWQDDNGNELYKVGLNPNAEELPPYKGEVPEKDHYDFEWDEPTEDNNGNTIIKGKFTPKKYTITWVDDNNNLLGEDQVTYGETPVYDAKKHKELNKDLGYASYKFIGWSPAIEKATKNQTYTAQYEMNGPENGQEGQGGDNGQGNQGGNDNNPPVVIPTAITYYTITWANYDGAGSTKTTQVAAGDRPSYNGTPAKAEDAENTYTFIGWTPNITVATGDETYTALFTATKKDNNNNNPTPKPTSGPTKSRDYKINYYEEQADGTLVKLKKTLNPDTYTYGVGAEIKYGIDKEGYKFLGWYSQKTGKRVTRISKNSKGEKTLIAKFVPIDDGTGEGNGNGSGTPASEFGILFVRLVDYTADSMTLKWQPIEGVDGYDIFGSRCNSKDVIRPYEPIASVGADASEYKMEGLLAKTYYKFYIRAYILVNKEKRYITTSINVHGVTLNDTYGVADEINIDKIVLKYINGKSKTKFDSATGSKSEDVINITLKVGQSLVLVSSEKSNAGKEIRAHRPISFESSDPDVCKVGKKKSHKYGKAVTGMDNTYKSYAITAVAAGECDIHAFAQNGIYTTIHVTVK